MTFASSDTTEDLERIKTSVAYCLKRTFKKNVQLAMSQVCILNRKEKLKASLHFNAGLPWGVTVRLTG